MSREIEMILSAFEKLRDGDYDLGDPLQKQILQVNSAPDGLIVPEMVEIMLGREISTEEEDFIFLRAEDAEGCASPKEGPSAFKGAKGIRDTQKRMAHKKAARQKQVR